MTKKKVLSCQSCLHLLPVLTLVRTVTCDVHYAVASSLVYGLKKQHYTEKRSLFHCSEFSQGGHIRVWLRDQEIGHCQPPRDFHVLSAH